MNDWICCAMWCEGMMRSVELSKNPIELYITIYFFFFTCRSCAFAIIFAFNCDEAVEFFFVSWGLLGNQTAPGSPRGRFIFRSRCGRRLL